MDSLRLLSLLDRLENYTKELNSFLPKNLSTYLKSLEKRRFCERTLQLLIEVCIDISQQLVKELKLGLPTEEENVFDKLSESKIISKSMHFKLKEMKRFRNILIHNYAKIDDSLVYDNAIKNSKDFLEFKQEILAFLKNGKYV